MPHDSTPNEGGRARPHPLIRGAHQSSNSILVNSCQHVKGVAWEFADIVPDYQVGLSSGVLFLSLRYFRLHPEYIHMRIQKLAHMYTLRILLVLCDVPAIKELTKIALVNRMAGRYLETYKAFEQRPPDTIRTRVGDTYMSQLTAALTSVRGVNKTDVMTLATHVGSLLMLPGMGEVKVDNLVRAMRQPFRTDGKPRPVPATGAAADAPPADAPPDAPSETLEEAAPLPFDSLPDNFDSLPEEEQLRLAMQLSVEGLS